jgi:hypothetical protein
LSVTLCLSWTSGTSAEKDPLDVDSVRTVLEKWVETRRAIAGMKQDWTLKREMLKATIELREQEIQSLRTKIAEAREGITDTDKKRAELLEQQDKLKEASAALDVAIVDLERRTLELVRPLPKSIRDEVAPFTGQIPQDPDSSKLSLGIRFQNVVGLLNDLNKRNRDVTVTSEVRELPDGSSVEVTVLYVGIAQAYYVSNNGRVAGVGTATTDGWTWRPDNAAAGAIARAIAIMRNEQVASFVTLPVEVR